MSNPTLLIVSYYFAPTPLIGARRFSFLTREFVRMGYDVTVIASAAASAQEPAQSVPGAS